MIYFTHSVTTAILLNGSPNELTASDKAFLSSLVTAL